MCFIFVRFGFCLGGLEEVLSFVRGDGCYWSLLAVVSLHSVFVFGFVVRFGLFCDVANVITDIEILKDLCNVFSKCKNLIGY